MNNRRAIAQALEQAWTQRRNEFLSQVGYCRAGETAGHYILIENHGSGAYTKGWWLWKRLITYEDGGRDIYFSATILYDDNDWLDNYFRISDKEANYFYQRYQVEFAPTEEIRDIVILRLFDTLFLEGPDGRPERSLGRKSENPAGRFRGAEGFHALATEIDASITPDFEYMSKNKITTLTHLSESEIVRKNMDELACILRMRYDYSLALRSTVARSRSEELGEMSIQEVPERAKKVNLAWTPRHPALPELLSKAEVQEVLTTLATTLAAYGYYLTARPLVLAPDTEDPWAEFR